MQPIAFFGILLLLSPQAQAAPSSLHSHLQRHRDRAATHAHLSHQHAKLNKKAETETMKSFRDIAPLFQNLMATDKPSAPSPYVESTLTPLKHDDELDHVYSDSDDSQLREARTESAREQPGPERTKLAAIGRGESRVRSVADAVDSRHADSALRLLRAHAVVKRNRFQREI
ncbi:hypothetical protein CORC01_11101 [Colletotrichum orchidophilum]|uniref:Uncharacterized protein n=1 Tax=Colletotrichum orchidophilum TaxID=1209926 RepID=A0A1G4AX26_9PEZI|nr:uncharacterized protein CORC01_11101 [Colletotrichum orchidophilum]OHE93602.1 hypothetical protein CORC01_11101 [Colletotrichum orchidophilum]